MKILPEVLKKKEHKFKPGMTSVELNVPFKNLYFIKLMDMLDKDSVNYTIDFTNNSITELTILKMPQRQIHILRNKLMQVNSKIKEIIRYSSLECACTDEAKCRIKGCLCKCHIESKFLKPSKWRMTSKQHVELVIKTLGFDDPITKIHIRHFRNHMSQSSKHEICHELCDTCKNCGLFGEDDIVDVCHRQTQKETKI